MSNVYFKIFFPRYISDMVMLNKTCKQLLFEIHRQKEKFAYFTVHSISVIRIWTIYKKKQILLGFAQSRKAWKVTIVHSFSTKQKSDQQISIPFWNKLSQYTQKRFLFTLVCFYKKKVVVASKVCIVSQAIMGILTFEIHYA